jgi:hypothetical protein
VLLQQQGHLYPQHPSIPLHLIGSTSLSLVKTMLPTRLQTSSREEKEEAGEKLGKGIFTH